MPSGGRLRRPLEGIAVDGNAAAGRIQAHNDRALQGPGGPILLEPAWPIWVHGSKGPGALALIFSECLFGKPERLFGKLERLFGLSERLFVFGERCPLPALGIPKGSASKAMDVHGC